MRMRTIDQAHADLLEADPNCALTKTALRRMVVSGRVPSCRMGIKYLIDLDKLPEYLFSQDPEQQPETIKGIRRLEVQI